MSLKTPLLRHGVDIPHPAGQGTRPCPYPDCSYTYLPNCSISKHMTKVHGNENGFPCPTTGCEYSFKTTHSLIRHLLIHTGVQPYKCDFANCIYTSAYAANLKTHRLRKHTPELIVKNHKCSVCPFKTDRLTTFKSHQLSHSSHKPFRCSVADCKFATKTEKCLMDHGLRFHGSERPHPCPHPGCSYQAKTRGNLSDHRKVHETVKRLACPIDNCTYRCVQHQAMKSHVRTHTGDKPFVCNFCGHRTTTSGSLRNHMTTHTGEKSFKCQLCKFTTAHKNSLTSHVKNHNNEKFPCPVEGCPFRSSQQANLKSHYKRIHSDVRNFPCPLCEYRAKVPDLLTIHMRVHTGEKPYSCTLCDYSTTQNSHLRTHMKSHARIKDFGKHKCPHQNCNYANRSGREDKLRAHLKSHEKGKFMCEKCEYSGNKKGLAIHASRAHGLNWSFSGKKKTRGGTKDGVRSCQICQFSGVDEKEVIVHNDQQHKLPRVILSRLDPE